MKVNLERPRIHLLAHRYLQLRRVQVRGGGLSQGNVALWACLLAAQTQRGWRGNALEIGVWRGEAAGMLANYIAPSAKLVLVDKYVDWDTFIPNVRPFLESPDSTIDFRREDSLDVAKTLALSEYRNTISFAHIDGEHSYEAVYSDLDLVAPLMMRGGVIAIDDIFNFGGPGMTESLFRWLAENSHRAVLFLTAFNKAYLCPPRELAFYLRCCFQMVDILSELGVEVTLTRSGWATERAGLGMIPRAGSTKFMTIGREYESVTFEEFMVPTTQ